MREERLRESAKRHLKVVVKKKFTTSIIATLDILEKGLGDIWGHGLDPSECDEDQEYYKHLWEEIREQILDKGNSQMRGALSEIDGYTINKDRYETNLIIKPRGNNG